MAALFRRVLMNAFLPLTIAIMTCSGSVVVNAQQLPGQPPIPQGENTKFQSIGHNFSISIPQGWVIQNLSDADTSSLLAEMLHGYRILAQLCPQEQAFRGIGGTYNCNEAHDIIYINRYPNLSDEPEFASIANDNNNSVAANEYFLKYQITKLEELGYSDVNLTNNTGTVINVSDATTNRTISKVPGNLVEMTYTKNSTETRGYFLLTATNAISDTGIISGYDIFYEGDAGKMPSGSPPQPIKQVFESFEFVKEQSSEQQVAADDNSSRSSNSSAGPATQQPAIALPSAILQYQANNTT